MDPAGHETPVLPCEFLLDPDPRRDKARPYLGCTSARDSRYGTARETDEGQDRLRRWEPSIDEYTGLVAAYLAAFDAFNPDLTRTLPGPPVLTAKLHQRADRIIAKVKAQTTRIARYLQGHAYVLVRPCGGVTMRGAGETNPCMAYAFGKAFERILGQGFPVTAGFDDAMAAAGLTDCPARGADLPNLPGAIAQLRSSPVWQRLTGLFGSDPIGALQGALTDLGPTL